MRHTVEITTHDRRNITGNVIGFHFTDDTVDSLHVLLALDGDDGPSWLNGHPIPVAQLATIIDLDT